MFLSVFIALVLVIAFWWLIFSFFSRVVSLVRKAFSFFRTRCNHADNSHLKFLWEASVAKDGAREIKNSVRKTRDSVSQCPTLTEPVLIRTKNQKIFSYTLAFLIGISALLGSIGVIIFVPVALIALTIASVVCLVRRKQKAHEQ